LTHYLSLFFFPHPDRLAFVLKYPISHTLFSPITTIISWGGIAALLITSSIYIRRHPLIWLAIFWFFINHLLESTFIQLEMAFVHRNYLPSIFLFLPAACWLAKLKKPPLTVIAPVFILLVLFLNSWNSRAAVWGAPIKFWEDSIEKSPGSLRAYINLGVIWDIKKQPVKAMEIYQKGAEKAYDENRVAWASLYCNMGIASMNLEQYGPAQIYMNKSLTFSSMPDCLINMAKLQLKLGNPGMVMRLMDELARTRPRHRKLHLMRARAYLAVGQIAAARMELLQELALFPQNTEAKSLLKTVNKSNFDK
jgi:tetratricopeptide (TPR) repeat protein